MTITYFTPKPQTLEELKKLYKELAMQNHPDCGGDTKTMKAINNEYDYLFPTLKNIRKNKDGEVYTTKEETQETADAWKDMIAALINLNMENVLVEIIGSFIWISGNTYPYRSELKELGYRWSNNKAAWYLSPPDYKKFSRKTYDMNDIRNMYGNIAINVNTDKVALMA